MTTARSKPDLADVLTMLDSYRQHPPVETQRKFKRHSVRGDARLEPMDPDSPEPATKVLLRDISRGGVGFLCDHFVEPGASYRIQFHQNGFPVGSQPIVVCFCRLVQDDLYMVGGQYVIEPFIMAAMGVSPEQIAGESLDAHDPNDVSDFLAPEAAFDEFDKG